MCVIAKQDDTDVNLKIHAVDNYFDEYYAVRTPNRRVKCDVNELTPDVLEELISVRSTILFMNLFMVL